MLALSYTRRLKTHILEMISTHHASPELLSYTRRLKTHILEMEG
jgi:hypothetical protein